MNLPNEIQNLLSQRQTRAVVVGFLILAVIAVLQVVQNNSSQDLVALMESQQLCDGDLERMEFAIGKAGITGCKIENGRLMVPEHRKEQCLNAVASSDALPQFLRKDSDEPTKVNPFLSRAQQRQVLLLEKKRLVREMVIRLPFVKNAWFEMDTAAGGSVFKPAQQTAVISVEPHADVTLDSDQVATIREMISGAIAGLATGEIGVIDVVSGYAHRAGGFADQSVVAVDKRPPFEQETFYRKRIQQAVKAYGDIEVQVQVDVVEDRSTIQTVAHSVPVPRKEPDSKFENFATVIGTNGSASIHDDKPKVPVQKVAAAPKVPKPVYTSRVDVILQVPESIASQLSIGKDSFPTDKPNIKQQAVNRLGRQLVDAVKPILPKPSFAQGTPFPIAIQFTPAVVEAPLATPRWQDRIQELALKHWPSVAVLMVGLVLLTMMTRSPQIDSADADELMDEDIISINAPADSGERSSQPLPEVALAQPEDYARRAAEQKLGTLVENDPESAARVIESWIRKAG
jgi:flagellar biosynthesis/type III secretory pathway M-ring protein FliF/YscJ